jgi:molecular chaperone GrpE
MNDDQNPTDPKTSQSDNQNGNQTKPEPQTQNGSQPQNQSGSPQTTVNDEEYNKLKTELEATQTKLNEMVAISQRALADLQNFKRRTEEERENFIQFASAQVILEFLPAISNVERAFKHEPKDNEWVKGIEQILKQLTQVLEKHGVKEIQTLGQKFDPKLHEALMTGQGEKDIVIEEFEKGYLLGDRVIKQARVKVGDGS